MAGPGIELLNGTPVSYPCATSLGPSFSAVPQANHLFPNKLVNREGKAPLGEHARERIVHHRENGISHQRIDCGECYRHIYTQQFGHYRWWKTFQMSLLTLLTPEKLPLHLKNRIARQSNVYGHADAMANSFPRSDILLAALNQFHCAVRGHGDWAVRRRQKYLGRITSLSIHSDFDSTPRSACPRRLLRLTSASHKCMRQGLARRPPTSQHNGEGGRGDVTACVVHIHAINNARWPLRPSRVRLHAGSLPDFRTWKPFRTMPLVGGFSRGSPIFPPPRTRLTSPSSALKAKSLPSPQLIAKHADTNIPQNAAEIKAKYVQGSEGETGSSGGGASRFTKPDHLAIHQSGLIRAQVRSEAVFRTRLDYILVCAPALGSDVASAARIACEVCNEVDMEQRWNKGAGILEIPRKPFQPAASPGSIPTCENPRVTRSGIETGSPWWDASCLTRHDVKTTRLARRGDEGLEVRVSVARIAPSLLVYGGGGSIEGVYGRETQEFPQARLSRLRRAKTRALATGPQRPSPGPHSVRRRATPQRPSHEALECKSRGKRKIIEKTCQPVASPDTIFALLKAREQPRRESSPGSYWWEAGALITRPPRRPVDKVKQLLTARTIATRATKMASLDSKILEQQFAYQRLATFSSDGSPANKEPLTVSSNQSGIKARPQRESLSRSRQRNRHNHFVSVLNLLCDMLLNAVHDKHDYLRCEYGAVHGMLYQERKKKGGGVTEETRDKPTDQRRRPARFQRARKSGSGPEIAPGSPWREASVLVAAPSLGSDLFTPERVYPRSVDGATVNSDDRLQRERERERAFFDARRPARRLPFKTWTPRRPGRQTSSSIMLSPDMRQGTSGRAEGKPTRPPTGPQGGAKAWFTCFQ
ncbi:hypothetical protein PR048_022059 [Dryococelus australis]|uniref:Uncharacterized protein n=1 Tax=Dryococelus australis TaxID=614101 RepID=A0ABQ9GZX5_9NEOP|nr:hypothetical protein PR048_022059 [Dryococelus australis]